MLLRKFFLTAAFGLAIAGVAQADRDSDDDSSDDNGNNGYSAFFQCLYTDAVRFDGTIVDAAVATPALSTLVDLVVAADLASVLAGEGNFTVFAPTNDAFAAIPAGILDTIGSDVNLLSAVLTYHVLPRAGRSNDPRRVFNRVAERTTVQGQSVFFNRSEDGPQVNQSNVSCQAVKTDNGTVWIIDSVLLPQF